jgi:serine/threonine protein kinase
MNRGEKKSTLRDFDLLKQIGKGSYGTVYKARRKSDKQIYAIKTINIGRPNQAKWTAKTWKAL